MTRMLSSSVLALVVAAAPALADVTPAQVWESLKSQYGSYGSTVTVGNEAAEGDTLTLTDIVIAGEGQGTARVTIPQMVLQQTGDAGVRSVIEGDVQLSLPAAPESGVEGFDAALSLPGNEMISSGTPEELTHRITYPSLVLTRTDDDAQPVMVTLTDIEGSQRTVADASETSYDLKAAGLDLQMEMIETTGGADATAPAEPEPGAAPDSAAPEGGDAPGAGATAPESAPADAGEPERRVSTMAQLQDLTFSGRMTGPQGGIDPALPLNAALKAGLSFDGRLAFGPANTEVSFTGTDENGAPRKGDASFASDSGEFAVTLAESGLTYEGSAAKANGEVNMADLPVPLSYAVEAASGRLTVPLSGAQEPQPFAMRYALAGVTLSDSIWGLFDPDGQLPRDPASISVDADGTVLLTRDLLDPALSEPMAPEAGAEGADGETAGAQPDSPAGMMLPRTLTINQIALDAVGVEADVAGTLTFGDNLDQPVGQIDGSFTGLSGLLDNLVRIGVVPQEQLMAARMMMTMFTQSVEGSPEQSTTAVEFREGGSIYINGQQVR